jgi:hypothetical protein
VLTHYAVRAYEGRRGHEHLNSWPVGVSLDRESEQGVVRQEDNSQLNGIQGRQKVVSTPPVLVAA